MWTAVLAAESFEKDLAEELRLAKAVVKNQFERLFVIEGPATSTVWAEDIWPDCEIVDYSSISTAAKLLKSRGKYWVPYSYQLHRRGSLIQEQLPKFKTPPVNFNKDYVPPIFGTYCLLSDSQLLICNKPTGRFPLGQWKFQEDKASPSRAYLKLWELFTRENFRPHKDEVCMDLGSSPGGWTQVLAHTCKKVISVDKAPLAPAVAKMKNVESLKKDAFKLRPEDVGSVDWLFSDIICEPAKLYDLVQLWQQSQKLQKFVCTIKFKGPTDFKTLQRFQEIPGSQILHLHHNKHEVTFLKR